MGLAFRLTLPANNKFPCVGEIPALTAKAIYPESENDLARECCQINHEDALDKAIKAGMVTPLNPLSYEQHTFPFGDALRRAVISLDDFKRFAETLQIEVVIWDELVHGRGASMEKLAAVYEQREQIKREHGRYTLEEAATFIHEQTGACAKGMKNKLIAAVENGELATYEPGHSEKYDSWVVRDFHEHVYWNDLNEWLEKNEPRLDCKFPNPADMPAAAKVEAIRGITKQQVVNAFDGIHFNCEQWNKALGKNIPEWLKTCQAMPGKKGDNKTSATWNPVLIAMALTDPKRGISVNKLDVVFVGLKDWADEWRYASDYLR